MGVVCLRSRPWALSMGPKPGILIYSLYTFYQQGPILLSPHRQAEEEGEVQSRGHYLEPWSMGASWETSHPTNLSRALTTVDDRNPASPYMHIYICVLYSQTSHSFGI